MARRIPRDIITLFTCTYNGEEIFRAELSPAIAANPFIVLLHDRDRERRDRIPLDRRQRLRDDRDRGRSRSNEGFPVRLALRLLGSPCRRGGGRGGDRRRRTALGLRLLSRETRAMQEDDAANPGMLWVLRARPCGPAGRAGPRSCADCHGDARNSMKGVAARYPAFDRRAAARRSRTAHQPMPHRTPAGAGAA